MCIYKNEEFDFFLFLKKDNLNMELKRDDLPIVKNWFIRCKINYNNVLKIMADFTVNVQIISAVIFQTT